jgi:hypothetical protein
MECHFVYEITIAKAQPNPIPLSVVVALPVIFFPSNKKEKVLSFP